jgi:hypothetical protein
MEHATKEEIPMQHPTVIHSLATMHAADLVRDAEIHRLAQAPPTGPSPGVLAGLTIREARHEDAVALARLAALDEKPVPAGRVLVAASGETVHVAVGSDGSSIADPFLPTAVLVGAMRRVLADLDPGVQAATPWRRLSLRALPSRLRVRAA